VTNPEHDRDATVDRLLAGAMARRSEDSAGGCLDADTLAAWGDNALDAGERAAAEAHAADCARCQALLAAMVKTAPATPDAAASLWRVPSLRWLVPLTAAAAAAIVWIVVPPRGRPTNVGQISQSVESIPPPAAAATDVVAPSSTPVVSSRARREQEAPQEKDVEADGKSPATPRANAVADAPTRSAGARLERVQTAAEAAASAPAAPPAAQAARAFAFGAPETVVVSSNPASRWRLLPGGAVQRSADGGSTWQTQDTGVSEALSAGASPSPSVCWLVGPRGIVLLSTDGRSWKRVALPEAVQLVAVRATDDQSATVTAADGREFVTDDGGQTWWRAPG